MNYTAIIEDKPEEIETNCVVKKGNYLAVVRSDGEKRWTIVLKVKPLTLKLVNGRAPKFRQQFRSIR